MMKSIRCQPRARIPSSVSSSPRTNSTASAGDATAITRSRNAPAGRRGPATAHRADHTRHVPGIAPPARTIGPRNRACSINSNGSTSPPRTASARTGVVGWTSTLPSPACHDHRGTFTTQRAVPKTRLWPPAATYSSHGRSSDHSFAPCTIPAEPSRFRLAAQVTPRLQPDDGSTRPRISRGSIAPLMPLPA